MSPPIVNGSPEPSASPASAQELRAAAAPPAPLPTTHHSLPDYSQELPPQIDPPQATLPQPSRWNRFPSTANLWLCLTALTAVAACFRFWRISYQCYWTDESYTINRIRGTFAYMLSSLSEQGFPPGWYAILRWWTLLVEYLTGSGLAALEPLSTRSFTAALGTLTVPAMYFLARQFTDRKGALLVALLTAVNPYLIYYSRDIKMYHATWLFVILNAAIFFQWQSTHQHLRWFPLYLLTGFLMTSLHSTAWFMVGLQLIFLLTRPRLKALDGPLWLSAVGAMSLLPIYWYLNGTRWVDRLIEHGGDTRLYWITDYTDMSWKTLASLPCSHLLGYLWPSFPPDDHVRGWFHLGGSDFDLHVATRAWPWLASAEFYVALAFAAILLVGLLPWRGLRATAERRDSITRWRFWWLAIWIILPTLCLALTWIPKDSPWHTWIWHSSNPSPLWEPRYLGIILPALILWLAASLRRLPTWPLRTIALTFVLGVSIFSACSNYLIFRNPPFHKAAEIAARYYDPKNRQTLAVGHVNLTNPGVVISLTYALARNVRPFAPGDYFLPSDNFDIDITGPNRLWNFLRQSRTNLAVKTIVLTDRNGDITDPNDYLSNESIAGKLGPRWRLVDEEKYVLNYEWRFYLFNTWRTRVWQRLPAPATMPVSQPDTSR